MRANAMPGAAALFGLMLGGYLLMPAASAQCTTDEPRVNRGGLIEWRQDIDDALTLAKKSNRPSILYFTADW